MDSARGVANGSARRLGESFRCSQRSRIPTDQSQKPTPPPPDEIVVVVLGTVVVGDGLATVVVVVFGVVVAVETLAGFTSTTSDHLPQVSVMLPFAWPAVLSSKNQNRTLPP